MRERDDCHVRGCAGRATQIFVSQPVPSFSVHWPVCDEHAHNLSAGDAYEGDDSFEIVLRHQWGGPRGGGRRARAPRD